MQIAPLEQFSNPTLLLPLLPLHVGLSKLSLYGVISLSLALLFFLLPLSSPAGLGSPSLVGNRWLATLEAFYASVHAILKDQIGEGFSLFLPMVFTLFTFLLFGNLFSNIPYSFGYTTSAVVCLGLSLVVFLGVTLLGLSRHRLAWFSFFVPSGSPLALVPLLVLIEFISYLARAFSLGIRLLANLVAGHILMNVLSSMIWGILTSGLLLALVSLLPFAIFTGLYLLELAVSVIQAYVFTLLFCSYLNDAVNLH